MSFETDLKRGEVAEGLALSYLLEKSKAIADVRNIESWQKKDVDFLVLTDTDMYKVEVKLEMAFKNLFYEVESYGKVGCFTRSEADIFLVYLPEMNGKLLSIGAKKLRKYIESTPMELVNNYDHSSKGYSIPISELIEKKIAKVVNENGSISNNKE